MSTKILLSCYMLGTNPTTCGMNNTLCCDDNYDLVVEQTKPSQIIRNDVSLQILGNFNKVNRLNELLVTHFSDYIKWLILESCIIFKMYNQV